MHADPIRVALIQMACVPSIEENLDHAAEMARQAARAGAQIVCLPELFRAQYFCQREDHRLFALAEPIPGPSTARLTALEGAQSIFIPTAIGWHPSEKAEFGAAQYSAWKAIQRAHAIANGVFVCAVNRVGHEHGDVIHDGTEIEGPGEHSPANGIEFWGGSFICDPFGRILAQASHNQEEIVTATLDPALVETTRQHWPFLRDRRIDAYGKITSRLLY